MPKKIETLIYWKALAESKGKIIEEYSVKIAFQEREIHRLRQELEDAERSKFREAEDYAQRKLIAYKKQVKPKYGWSDYLFHIFLLISMMVYGYYLGVTHSRPKPAQEVRANSAGVSVYKDGYLERFYPLRPMDIELAQCQDEWRSRGTEILNLKETNRLLKTRLKEFQP